MVSCDIGLCVRKKGEEEMEESQRRLDLLVRITKDSWQRCVGTKRKKEGVLIFTVDEIG